MVRNNEVLPPRCFATVADCASKNADRSTSTRSLNKSRLTADGGSVATSNSALYYSTAKVLQTAEQTVNELLVQIGSVLTKDNDAMKRRGWLYDTAENLCVVGKHIQTRKVEALKLAEKEDASIAANIGSGI